MTRCSMAGVLSGKRPRCPYRNRRSRLLQSPKNQGSRPPSPSLNLLHQKDVAFMQTRTTLTIIFSLLTTATLSSCSTVGPGLANHPADCALGIPWADCLPGTRGYANGGGSMHREAAQKKTDAINDQFKAIHDQCKADLQSPELDAIRHKVDLYRAWEDAPSFEAASNEDFPTMPERAAIAKWAALRDDCLRREHAVVMVPADATPMLANFMQQERAFYQEAQAHIGELMVALYQAKITYGEFARNRYEISKAAAKAQRQYRESRLIEDQQRQVQEQQVAQQQYQNNLMAWSVYMQSVAARQPQTVRLNTTYVNCTSTKTGNIVNTSCY